MFNDKILNSINDIIKNQEIYLVGGYLRNYFIKNKISKDRDLVCLKNAEITAKKIASRTFVFPCALAPTNIFNLSSNSKNWFS